MSASERRLPLDPLLRAYRWPEDEIVAEHAQVSRRTVIRWRAAGGVPEIHAERLAALFSRHPLEVWGPGWASGSCLD